MSVSIKIYFYNIILIVKQRLIKWKSDIYIHNMATENYDLPEVR